MVAQQSFLRLNPVPEFSERGATLAFSARPERPALETFFSAVADDPQRLPRLLDDLHRCGYALSSETESREFLTNLLKDRLEKALDTNAVPDAGQISNGLTRLKEGVKSNLFNGALAAAVAAEWLSREENSRSDIYRAASTLLDYWRCARWAQKPELYAFYEITLTALHMLGEPRSA